MNDAVTLVAISSLLAFKGYVTGIHVPLICLALVGDFRLRQNLVNRRKVSSLSFHSLRATTVTALRLAGVPADLCRVIVGHRSELIERVYFRPDEKDIAKAMEKLTLEPIPSVVEA